MVLFWVVELVLTVAVVAPLVKDQDLNVTCSSNSIIVTWKVNQSLATHPSKFSLGTCTPSSYSLLSDGAAVTFHVSFSDCRFKRIETADKIFYQNTLSSRPFVKPNAPEVSYKVLCAFDRHPDGIPPLSSSPYGHVVGYGGLHFYMAIMNDDFSGPAFSSSFPLGSRIPIWAAVDQQAHMPLILFLEECVASTAPELAAVSSRIYPLIVNGGCLVDGKTSASVFLPRRRMSEVLLFLQAFSFAMGEDIYIHCKMVAWDPEKLTTRMKACNYVKELGGWELLDDPSRSSLCSCCDSRCTSRTRRNAELESQGLVQNAILGPLTIEGVKKRNVCSCTSIMQDAQENPKQP